MTTTLTPVTTTTSVIAIKINVKTITTHMTRKNTGLTRITILTRITNTLTIITIKITIIMTTRYITTSITTITTMIPTLS